MSRLQKVAILLVGPRTRSTGIRQLGDMVAAIASEKDGTPKSRLEALEVTFRKLGENQTIRVLDGRSDVSQWGDPCMVVELEAGTTDNHYLEVRFLLRKTANRWAADLLASSPDEILPFNTNPPVLLGNHLVVAGMGSRGAMRTSPILQMWEKQKGRWRLKQTILHEVFAGNAYWLKPKGLLEGAHFVMEIPTDSPLIEGAHPAEDRRNRIQHWVYHHGRFRLVSSYWRNDPFLAAERFILAIRLGDDKTALRYASPYWLRFAKAHNFRRWDWPDKVLWMSKANIDLCSPNSDKPPTRLVLELANDRWEIVKIVPNCQAFDTWWSWGVRYQRAVAEHKPEPASPPVHGNSK